MMALNYFSHEVLSNDPEVVAAFAEIDFTIETFRSSKSIHQFVSKIIKDLNDKQLIHSRAVYYHPKIRLDMITQLLIHQLCLPRICDFLGMGFMEFSNSHWKDMFTNGNKESIDPVSHDTDVNSSITRRQNNYQLMQIKEIFVEIFTIHRLTEDITIETDEEELTDIDLRKAVFLLHLLEMKYSSIIPFSVFLQEYGRQALELLTCYTLCITAICSDVDGMIQKVINTIVNILSSTPSNNNQDSILHKGQKRDLSSLDKQKGLKPLATRPTDPAHTATASSSNRVSGNSTEFTSDLCHVDTTNKQQHTTSTSTTSSSVLWYQKISREQYTVLTTILVHYFIWLRKMSHILIKESRKNEILNSVNPCLRRALQEEEYESPLDILHKYHGAYKDQLNHIIIPLQSYRSHDITQATKDIIRDSMILNHTLFTCGCPVVSSAAAAVRPSCTPCQQKQQQSNFSEKEQNVTTNVTSLWFQLYEQIGQMLIKYFQLPPDQYQELLQTFIQEQVTLGIQGINPLISTTATITTSPGIQQHKKVGGNVAQSKRSSSSSSSLLNAAHDYNWELIHLLQQHATIDGMNGKSIAKKATATGTIGNSSNSLPSSTTTAATTASTATSATTLTQKKSTGSHGSSSSSVVSSTNSVVDETIITDAAATVAAVVATSSSSIITTAEHNAYVQHVSSFCSTTPTKCSFTSRNNSTSTTTTTTTSRTNSLDETVLTNTTFNSVPTTPTRKPRALEPTTSSTHSSSSAAIPVSTPIRIPLAQVFQDTLTMLHRYALLAASRTVAAGDAYIILNDLYGGEGLLLCPMNTPRQPPPPQRGGVGGGGNSEGAADIIIKVTTCGLKIVVKERYRLLSGEEVARCSNLASLHTLMCFECTTTTLIILSPQVYRAHPNHTSESATSSTTATPTNSSTSSKATNTNKIAATTSGKPAATSHPLKFDPKVLATSDLLPEMHQVLLNYPQRLCHRAVSIEPYL